MQYGDTLSTEDITLYIVETTYPRFGKPPKFGRYISTAFTPKDSPGPRNFFFRDSRWSEFEKLRVRYDYPDFPTHEFNDCLGFFNSIVAKACAEAIEKHAVLLHPYENKCDWAIRDRGIAIDTRVVEFRRTAVRREVF